MSYLDFLGEKKKKKKNSDKAKTKRAYFINS